MSEKIGKDTEETKAEESKGRLTTTWEGLTKDSEGEPQITTLHRYDHTTEDVDSQLFVSQAAPTIIRPSRRKRPERADNMTLVFGDAQIGYRGEEPFHDEVAMSVAQMAIRELMPDQVVFVGDMIDLPNFSTFAQRGDWQNSTQKSIDRYHEFLAQTRANAPNAKIVSIEGNHELRLDRMIRKDAGELLHIKQANRESQLGMLTMRFLCRMDELEVKSVSGYPNAEYRLNKNLKATHGTNVAKGGSNAAKYLDQSYTGTIFGHTHRLETAYRTIPGTNGEGRTIVASSPGALCRIDGGVPGFRHSVDEENETVLRPENWQQGMNIVETSEENEDILPVMFHGNRVKMNGKWYEVPAEEEESKLTVGRERIVVK